MRPDQKRALTDLRCASRKIAELFREHNQGPSADTLEAFVTGLTEQVKALQEVA